MKKKAVGKEWYNNPSIISGLIVGLIALIIILSQSFAVNGEVSGFTLFSNVLNHNISYMFIFVYFIILRFKVGKTYFNYINLVLMALCFIQTVASLLTVIQSFSLSSLLVCVAQFLIFIYLFHTFLRKTVIWKEFKLEKSVFNDFTNSWYFYSIVIVEVVLVTVDFITISNFDGIVLSLLDCLYTILFARYIYLYGEFINNKDGVINSFKDTVDMGVKKVQEFYEDNNISEKISDAIGAITGEGSDSSSSNIKKDKDETSKKSGNNNKKKGDE